MRSSPQKRDKTAPTFRARLRLKARRLAQKIFGQRDSASRIARGVAGGFLAAAVPVPGLQIPLSLLFAWAFRGNKAVAIFPQFISNAGTMLPLAVLQFKLGAVFWPGRSAEALEVLQRIARDWNTLAPWASFQAAAAQLWQFGFHAIGPLTVGVVLTGLAMAAISYPLTVMAVWAWRTARRRRRWMRMGRPPRRKPLRLPALDLAPGREEALEYCRGQAHFRLAEDVLLLVDGHDAFGQMLSAIGYAGSSVDLEAYLLRDDRTGRRFQQALVSAARRGLRVRLLYDWVGCMSLTPDFIRPMIDAGVEVRVYHPLVLARPSWAINRRDHRKILVVDGEIGFTGGLNIADEYASVEDGGAGWRDTHVRLSGKAVAGELERLFLQGWQDAMPYDKSSSPVSRLKAGLGGRQWRLTHPRRQKGFDVRAAMREHDGAAVHILGNAEFRFRRRIHRAYVYAIRRARRYILIENAYFIPNRSIRRALRRAVKRGVVVAVAVTRHSDVATAAYASRSLYSELLAAGVRLFEWPVGMLHAKTAVIDDAWAIVGSYNFDHRSLFHQLEAVAVVADPDFAVKLRDQTLADMALCQEVSLMEHEQRPWTRMMLESLAYMLKHWL